jgi:glycosyltransferase involved in cell wall biosynthesis
MIDALSSNKIDVSVITVVYNSVNSIEYTLQSVIKNKNKNVEYIVIDGGSTDGTVEIINKYKECIDCYISEKDNGIYDAMNKGINKSNGSYIYHLNCGDELLLDFDLFFKKNEIYGELILFDVLRSDDQIHKSKVDWRLKVYNTIHHQGVLYSKRLDIKYNLNFKVFSDFDLNQRIFNSKSNLQIQYFPTNIAYHNIDGISNTSKKYFKENYLIVKNNNMLIYLILAFVYYKIRGIKSRLK